MQCFMHIISTTDFMCRYRHTFFKSCAHKIKRMKQDPNLLTQTDVNTRQDNSVFNSDGWRDVEGRQRPRIKLTHTHTHTHTHTDTHTHTQTHTYTDTCFSWFIKHTHTPTHTCNLQAEPEPISCEGNNRYLSSSLFTINNLQVM